MSIDELDLIPEADSAFDDFDDAGLMFCVPVVSCFIHLTN